MSPLPLLLAMDTSTRTIGLALYDGACVICEWMWQSRDFHTVELAPAVETILTKCEFKVSNLCALAVAIGPGSFTGVRIGLALAKGLSLGCGLPLVGVSTLDVLAYAQPRRDLPMAVVLHAGRGRLAVGWFKPGEGSWQSTNRVELLSPQDLSERITEPTLVCGELELEERQFLARKRRNIILATPAESLRRASYLAEIGWQRWQSGRVSDPATLAPVYLHRGEPALD